MEMELMQVVAQYIRIELSIVIVALFVIGKFLKLTPNNGWMAYKVPFLKGLPEVFHDRLVPFETMEANGWFPEPDPETEG